jgi:hypothetical protein
MLDPIEPQIGQAFKAQTGRIASDQLIKFLDARAFRSH